MPVEAPNPRAFGVYIHFPWCQRLCPYCDFNTRTTRELPHEAYLQAVLRELEARKHRFEGARLVSIYLGGGTPSLWDPGCVARLIQAIQDTWPLLDDPTDALLAAQTTPAGPPRPLEITLEINPRSAHPERLQRFVEAGVNRLSVGLQTFDPDYLKRLGRDHSVEQALETLHDAQAVGLKRLSFDLLTAGPHHDLQALQRDLAQALQVHQADHISAYTLIIEPETPFARLDDQGRLHPADEDTAAAMLDLTHDALTRGGYLHYEISNYARPGREARHNSLYWAGFEYMGLGVGAHELAFVHGTPCRRAGALTPEAYLLDPAAPAQPEEPLDDLTHLAERLYLGLRTHFGVSHQALAAQFPPSLHETIAERLDRLTRRGLVERAGAPPPGAPAWLLPPGDRFVPTHRGMMFANQIALEVL